MTKFNELLTATPVQFAAVFGAVSAGVGPAPINVRPRARGSRLRAPKLQCSGSRVAISGVESVRLRA